MGLFNKRKKDNSIDSIIQSVYSGTPEDDLIVAKMYKNAGLSADQTRQALSYLHGESYDSNFHLSDKQISNIIIESSTNIAECYNLVKRLCPHISLGEEITKIFLFLTAASTDINPDLINGVNKILASDNIVLTYDHTKKFLCDIGFGDLIVNKRNTDQQSYLFEKLCDDIAGQSEYLKYVFSRNFEKRDLQNILRLFLGIIMGVSSIMVMGKTNGLLYTVVNNMLLSYYNYIYVREKDSIPEDYISHMKIVNKQMNDYMQP